MHNTFSAYGFYGLFCPVLRAVDIEIYHGLGEYKINVRCTMGMLTTTADFVAVGAGAAIGAWLRWGLSLWLNVRNTAIPLGTLAANLIGGFLVGLAVAYFIKHPDLSPAWRLFIVTGFLGGLTTFSTYSAEVVSLLERGDFVSGLTVALAHLLGSFALTALGFWLYRSVV